MAVWRLVWGMVWCLGAGAVLAEQRGVTPAEITVGSIQDLSGPLAGYGKQARNGMVQRLEEANEQGGVYGRKLRLVVEDAGYDPKKAVLAAQKLVEKDRIFALLGHLGTAHNNAVMPLLFEKNVPNFLPLSGSRDMYLPLHRLKYALLSAYYDQIRLAVPALVKERRLERVCVLYQDDDFGQEVLEGAQEGVRPLGLTLAGRASFKRGATDFSSQVAQLKAADCQMVVLGTIIRETAGALSEARRTDFNPVFLATSAAYSELVPKLGGKAVEGLYATMTSQLPALDGADVPIRFWASQYKTRFQEEPSIFAVYGYTIMDMFIKGVRKAGPDLSVDSFISAMDLTSFPSDSFGSPRMQYSATRRLGSSASRLSRIQAGRWTVVSDYLDATSESASVASPKAKAVKASSLRTPIRPN